MPTINAAPLFITDALVRIDGNDYEFSVSSAQITATTQQATFRGSAPSATYTASTTPTRNLVLTFAQDWDTPNSLSRTLENLQGQQKTVTIEPKKGGTGATGVVMIVPGGFGGATNAFATTTVTLGFIGQPQFTFITPNAKALWNATLGGSPTGGTWTLRVNGFATAPLAYNANAAAIAAAVNALSGVTGISGVTASGTAPIAITFPTNVTATATSALTGGTAPSVTLA